MIKAIIIDDELNCTELTSSLLKFYGENIELIATADSVENGYQAIINNPPDLVFLDVKMQDGTGFDLLKRLDHINFKVIFTTAHHEFAIDAFKCSALDYLLKPLSPLHFLDAIKKAQQMISYEELDVQLKTLLHNVTDSSLHKKKIVLKTLDKVYAIYTKDIIRFESEGSYTTVYVQDKKKIIVSRLLKEFDEILSASGFLRVHQSHLVNMEHMFCFEKQDSTLIMKDDSVVPVSTRKKEMLLSLLGAG